MKLHLKVVPKSSRDRVIGWMGERLKVAVSAPPEHGKANLAVIALIASTLGLREAQVRLVSGKMSPLKTVEVPGHEPDVMAKLPPRSRKG